mmetsp:Transcript_21796/g.62067  ORF Transcript_21796/g.62067 Transcript_21796/m.62067 type:complete len:244 (+) Transcript_21796:322-1053(+)
MGLYSLTNLYCTIGPSFSFRKMKNQTTSQRAMKPRLIPNTAQLPAAAMMGRARLVQRPPPMNGSLRSCLVENASSTGVSMRGSIMRRSMRPVAVVPMLLPISAMARSNQKSGRRIGAMKKNARSCHAMPKTRRMKRGPSESATAVVLVVATAVSTRKSSAAPEMRSMVPRSIEEPNMAWTTPPQSMAMGKSGKPERKAYSMSQSLRVSSSMRARFVQYAKKTARPIRAMWWAMVSMASLLTTR